MTPFLPLSSFTLRDVPSATAALNAMRLPVIAELAFTPADHGNGTVIVSNADNADGPR
jgi:hypothetical protein